MKNMHNGKRWPPPALARLNQQQPRQRPLLNDPSCEDTVDGWTKFCMIPRTETRGIIVLCYTVEGHVCLEITHMYEAVPTSVVTRIALGSGKDLGTFSNAFDLASLLPGWF